MATLNVELTNVMKNCLALSYSQSHWFSVEISCIDKNCIITVEGIVIFCLGVPIEEPDYIICEDINDDSVIILHSKTQESCVLSLKEKKILDHCKEVKEVFVDDYVNIGHDQVIFIFDDGDGEEDYYVTDYDCCMFDTRKGKVCDGNKPRDNVDPPDRQCDGYNSAITSLKTKILSTTSLLHDENARVCEKEEIIKITLDRLVRQSLDGEINLEDSPSLLDLLGEDTYSPVNQSETDPDANPFIVHKIWHKIYHEQIIIVVEIENQSKEYLHNLSLRLSAHDINISSTSEIIFFNKLTIKENSPTKLQKLERNVFEKNCMSPTKRCNLTSSTTYPDTPSSFVEFALAINYSKDNNRHYSVYVGKKKITIADLISDTAMIADEFSDRDAKSNIAFDFVNYKQNFVLSSKISSLFSLPTTISKRLNCQSIVFGNMTVLKPICLDAEVRFTNSAESCDCTVYAKKMKLLKMIVSEIEKVLPGDIECKLKFDLMRVLLKTFYDLLKREIDVSIHYTENRLSMIEDEYECDKEVIIIDFPKRKRVDISDNEILFSEVFDAVQSTDQFLISNQLFS